ncbi:glycosyltransferase [Salipiger sp. IMCC34102]|uniref:glycosyltransferase n=1 Tax=Salipiger sp. IMCC34102 TaxID=2510647 RepID=UPI0013EA6050|nr:glycosyltransferase [Salipiger sp. IMCC34102]
MTQAIVVIPARNEAALLPAALASLRQEGLAALVVANGCTDATAALARAAGVDVIETPALDGGVGAARAIGLAAAMDRGAEILFTVDADCRLAPGTAATVRRALGQADAVFGRVVPNAADFALLPAEVRRHGLAEDRRDGLRALIASAAAARLWDPFPAHAQSPGALIAWRVTAYRATGGIARVACHEDRQMAATLAVQGLRVARPWGAVTIASCRLTGRAPGGMADTIAQRTRLGARLVREAADLERECAELEQRLSAFIPRADWPDLPTLSTEGDENVSSFQQATV